MKACTVGEEFRHRPCRVCLYSGAQKRGMEVNNSTVMVGRRNIGFLVVRH